MDLGNKSPVV